MKKILLLLFSVAIFSSCTKTDRSTLNEPCTDSCTTVQGRFITGNNEGIANISYEIKSVRRGLVKTTIRRIASGKTDNNGLYSSTFAVRKNEFGEMGNADVSIFFSYDKAKFIPVSWYESYGTHERLGPFQSKDTTITANIFLTTRTKLKVRLENFTPVLSGDNFAVFTWCDAGLDRRHPSGGYIEANQPVTEGEIDACGNEQTTVVLRKRKNGVTSSSSTTVATVTGQTTSVTFTY